ncbi:hypothetical protein QAD02_003281 [Eretmocerus hayati]|uniref:Uncharacterized protein n=1 Tax=Eretmocerus hayati TaxID=131215 RepID=A0ACC2NLQ0_9HYME|nr:hypothetical protein QAD02_003281 [Eretmocerus hayati]
MDLDGADQRKKSPSQEERLPNVADPAGSFCQVKSPVAPANGPSGSGGGSSSSQMSSMREELLVKWGGINSLYREEESLMQDITSHLQEMNNIAKTVNNTPKGVRAELGDLNLNVKRLIGVQKQGESLRREFGAILRSVARGIDHTPGGNADVSGTASNGQCTPTGSNKRKKSSPPSENDKEKRRPKRKDLRVRVQKSDQTPQGLFTPSSQPAIPLSRKGSVSGNGATDSEMEWETQRRRARPKKEEKSKRKADGIRIRPDAIVVKQKAGNATYVETLKLMESKVDGTFAGDKFEKVRQTKSGELLIELQKGAKVAEVRQTIASSLGEDVRAPPGSSGPFTMERALSINPSDGFPR